MNKATKYHMVMQAMEGDNLPIGVVGWPLNCNFSHIIIIVVITYSLHGRPKSFIYSLIYLQNQINNYKQTSRSTVCVNYDYATVHKMTSCG